MVFASCDAQSTNEEHAITIRVRPFIRDAHYHPPQSILNMIFPIIALTLLHEWNFHVPLGLAAANYATRAYHTKQAREAKKPNGNKQDPLIYITEAVTITSSVLFVYCSWTLAFGGGSSSAPLFDRSRHFEPYLVRLASLTTEQLINFVLASLTFLFLLFSVGIYLQVAAPSSASRGSLLRLKSNLSRMECWCVVILMWEVIYCFLFISSKSLTYLRLSAVEATTTAAGSTKALRHREWSGLLWGLGFAGFGQVVILSYHYLRRERGFFTDDYPLIQQAPTTTPRPTFFSQALAHFAKPSSFALLIAYLSLIWKASAQPESYYDEDIAKLRWSHVLAQLVVVDAFTYINHLAEHSLAELYRLSHKPHHRFTSPELFDAFDGSFLDTLLIILLPLFATCRLLAFVNAWSYIAFGFVYSVHFMMIHSERPHPFDELIRSRFGVYTAVDHHLHHAKFVVNYAHFFTFWDRVFGTYMESF